MAALITDKKSALLAKRKKIFLAKTQQALTASGSGSYQLMEPYFGASGFQKVKATQSSRFEPGYLRFTVENATNHLHLKNDF